MSYTDERAAIAKEVAAFRAQFGLLVEPARRGPVALGRCLSECNLLHVELPHLSRGAVYDHLLAEGYTPGALGEEEALAGFLYVTPGSGMVFVNSDDPVQRRRFTAAHELGHYVLHRAVMGGTVSIGDTAATVVEVRDDKAAAMERQANRFAAELLMPAEVCRERAAVFRKAYRVCSRFSFGYQLAGELLVSPEAMRYRLAELELGDE